jgi:CubicO group peptidase (beta-lactamase class C family)
MRGIDQAKVDDLLARARREVDEGLLPSCQVALARDDELVVFEAFGDTTLDSRYVVFSTTKGFVAGLVWMLMGEGALDPSMKVAELIPEFGTNGKDVVTLDHVLLHTSGFPRAPLGPRDWAKRESRLEAFARWRLNWDPGTRFEYHPTSAHWVLAELIDRATGGDYRQLVRERIVEPLGLPHFALGVPLEDQGDILELELRGEPATEEEFMAAIGIPGIDVGEVTDKALMGFNTPEARVVGVPGAGGIGTAADLALYYQGVMHNSGGLWDPEVLADATGTVRNNFTDPMTGQPASRSRGLHIAGDDGKSAYRGMGHTVSPRAFGHDGAAGQIAWGDPETGLSFGYVTNGIDQHLLRQHRRTAGIASRAAVCASA